MNDFVCLAVYLGVMAALAGLISYIIRNSKVEDKSSSKASH